MEILNLENLFAKASRIKESKTDYHTSEEWTSIIKLDGAKRFKRKTLGLCGRNSVKSLDEIAQLLHQTGITSSVEEGKEIVPQLMGHSVVYGHGYDGVGFTNPKSINFEEVKNSSGQKAYRIYVSWPSLP